MIAGFVVIFTGVIGYAVSLVIRSKRIAKRYFNLEDNE
jgi:hypothetical protein